MAPRENGQRCIALRYPGFARLSSPSRSTLQARRHHSEAPECSARDPYLQPTVTARPQKAVYACLNESGLFLQLQALDSAAAE